MLAGSVSNPDDRQKKNAPDPLQGCRARARELHEMQSVCPSMKFDIAIQQDHAGIPVAVSRLEQAIQLAATPEEINHLSAMTDMVMTYAKKFYAQDEEVISRIRAAKIDLQVKMGRILEALPKAPGGRPPIESEEHALKNRFSGEPVSPAPATLAEIGVDKKTAYQAQKLAALPPEKIDAIKSGSISVKKAIAETAPAKPKKVKEVSEVDRLKAKIAELEEKVEKLEADLENAHDAAEQAIETAKNLESISNGEDAKRLETLAAKWRASEAAKHGLMNENAALKQRIRALERQSKVA